MKRTRTYYCKECKGSTDFVFPITETIKCECGYAFGRKFNNTKNHVNMRTTWSGQTQVEFTPQTMQESVEGMGGEW